MYFIYLTCGICCLILGIIGLFLPLLPTTPFALLAIYCFDRSSPRLRQWVLQTPWLGPLVREWQDSRRIPLRAKVISTALILLCAIWAGVKLGFSGQWWPLLIAYPVMIAVLLFLWTRKH